MEYYEKTLPIIVFHLFVGLTLHTPQFLLSQGTNKIWRIRNVKLKLFTAMEI